MATTKAAKPTAKLTKDEALVYNPSLDKWTIVPTSLVETLKDSGYTEA